MKTVKANAQLISHNIHPYKLIEKIGRICYKSEDKITDDSASKFVQMLAKNGHTAMLEHATIYFECPQHIADILQPAIADMSAGYNNFNTEYLKYIKISTLPYGCNYISGSLRTFYDIARSPYGGIKTLQYLLEPLSINFPELFDAPVKHVDSPCRILTETEFINNVKFKTSSELSVKKILSYHLTHSVLFTCDRGVSHELVRHRPCSFAQESTRYCNYSKDKFGHNITVIEPAFFAELHDNPEDDRLKEFFIWQQAMENAETAYFDLLEQGATPQEARSVLPNSLKTEIVLTATELEWQHILNLRYHGTTGKPHPQMYEIMDIAYPHLIEASEHRLS